MCSASSAVVIGLSSFWRFAHANPDHGPIQAAGSLQPINSISSNTRPRCAGEVARLDPAWHCADVRLSRRADRRTMRRIADFATRSGNCAGGLATAAAATQTGSVRTADARLASDSKFRRRSRARRFRRSLSRPPIPNRRDERERLLRELYDTLSRNPGRPGADNGRAARLARTSARSDRQITRLCESRPRPSNRPAASALQAGLPPNPSFGYEGDSIAQGGTAGMQGGKIEQLIKTAGKLKLAQSAALIDVVNAQVALAPCADRPRHAGALGVLRDPGRGGKSAALARAVPVLRGDVQGAGRSGTWPGRRRRSSR